MPQSIIADEAAERMVITTMFLRKGVQLAAVERLRFDDFFFEPMRLYFKAFTALIRDGVDPNMVMLRTKLIEKGAYERAGGDAVLTEIISGYSANDLEGLFDTLITLGKRRKLRKVAEDVFAKCSDPVQNVDAVLSAADEEIRTIRVDRSSGIQTMAELCNVSVEELGLQGQNMITAFDKLNGLDVFRDGSYAILAARTSKGKTAMALNIAAGAALHGPVLFFSLEMGAHALRNRILSSLSSVDDRRIRNNQLNDNERTRLNDALKSGRTMPLEVVDNKRSIFEICAIVKRRHMEKPFSLVVVDYIQKVKTSTKNLQRHQQLGEISGEFQGLVRDTGIRLLCCAQLNRSADNREPELIDLRESGDLEQDADVVMFLHAQDDGITNGYTPTVRTDLLVKKNRSGPLGKVELLFERPYTRFVQGGYEA